MGQLAGLNGGNLLDINRRHKTDVAIAGILTTESPPLKNRLLGSLK